MHRWLQLRFDDIAVVDRGAPPKRRDWIVSASLMTLGFSELFLSEFTWPIARTATLLVAVAVLPFRRQLPMHTTLLAFVTQFVVEVTAVNQGAGIASPVGQVIAGFMLIYAMCRWLPPQRALVGLALTTVLVSATEFADDSNDVFTDLFDMLPWVVLALIALAMRYRARLAEERATANRLAERNALARELHDTVAHHVSAIAVQAQAARFVGASDPEAAIANMKNIEDIANTTIEDMRRMVGILRSDNDHFRTVVAGSFETLTGSGAIPPVTITGEMSLEHLPTVVGAAVFRIAQESVTNARRHSRELTFIDIKLTTSPTEVALEIRNDGIPHIRGRGYGLIGMRERAESLGGTITSEPRPGSGWIVQATIPVAGQK